MALSGGIVLEEAVDLSCVWQITDDDDDDDVVWQITDDDVCATCPAYLFSLIWLP
jgi:hypothetical protein